MYLPERYQEKDVNLAIQEILQAIALEEDDKVNENQI